MRIITADETGLVKAVRLESGEILARGEGKQTRSHAIRALCRHSDSGSHDCIFHAARTEGLVETWTIVKGTGDTRPSEGPVTDSALIKRAAADCPSGAIAVASIPPAVGSRSHRVLTCNTTGDVQVSKLSQDGWELAMHTSFSVRGPVTAAASGVGKQAEVAVGGRENDVKTYDLETSRCLWKAKNLSHDTLDLRRPVWISALQSLAPERGIEQFVSGTAHRQVRIYDTRAQARPTHSIDADQHGVTTLAVVPDGREVVVADTAGLVRVLDIRKMRWGRRFPGPAGSVRGLALHPTLPVLACVGLDRMARVYDLNASEQKHQVYLKQRLNAVLFDEEGEVRVAANKPNGGEEGRRYGSGGSDDEPWGSVEEYEMDASSSDEDRSDGDDAFRETRNSESTGSVDVRQNTEGNALVGGRRVDYAVDDVDESGAEDVDERSGVKCPVSSEDEKSFAGAAFHDSSSPSSSDHGTEDSDSSREVEQTFKVARKSQSRRRAVSATRRALATKKARR